MPQREGRKVGIYRSRLEQSWAMFFVEYGIPFIYEPRYYYNWLPDFELPDCQALIEIKPTLKITKEELPRYYEGMKLAFNEGKDSVLLVHKPMFNYYGRLGSIFGFSDRSFNTAWSVKTFWGTNFNWYDLVKCVKCGACYFISNLGHHGCRKCGYHDGQSYIPLKGSKVQGGKGD